MAERRRTALVLFVRLAVAALAAAPAAFATTVAPPANLGQLARLVHSVVLAEALESRVEPGATLPETITRFRLAERVAGADPGAIFEVRAPGGSAGARSAAVAGSPRFANGRRYLLFLDRAPAGRWQSKTLAYGLLEEDAASGLLRPLAAAGRIELKSLHPAEPVGVYRKQALLGHLREVARGAQWSPARAGLAATAGSAAGITAKTLEDKPADCAFITDAADNLPIRWFGYETGATTATVMATTPGQTGISDGGVASVQQGAAAWTNHPDSAINLAYGGIEPSNITCSGNFDDQRGAVVFNDPCNDLDDLSSCMGTLSFGGVIYDNTTTRTYDGQPWHPAFSLFVIVNNGTECIGETGFKETVTHELGHTQGFGHHTPPDPSMATMSAFLKNDGRGAAIAITDKVCASYAYHTFLDVPFANNPLWRFIQAIYDAGVTAGCGGGNFCPHDAVTRGQMAVFLLVAKEGTGYTPPACTTPKFNDVPCSNPFAPWINELANRGVTAGCGSGNYCPTDAVTRAQMAVFLLATKEGTGYTPPACTTPKFNDVPCSSPFAPWINELANRGITGGCGAGNYCPTAVVSRDQMSVFLTATYGLPIPPTHD